VVFVVLVLRDAAVVHDVEESGETDGHLNEGSDPAVLGETVLVVPAPVSPGQSPPVSNGIVELSASEPGRELVNLHLRQREVSLPVEHSRVIRAVDSLVVTRRKVSQHL